MGYLFCFVPVWAVVTILGLALIDRLFRKNEKTIWKNALYLAWTLFGGSFIVTGLTMKEIGLCRDWGGSSYSNCETYYDRSGSHTECD